MQLVSCLRILKTSKCTHIASSLCGAAYEKWNVMHMQNNNIDHHDDMIRYY